MPEHVPCSVQERDAEVTLDPQVNQRLVSRELSLNPEGVVAQPATHNVLAWGARQVVLDVGARLSFAPVGESADASCDPGEFGDEGVAHADRGGKVPHQGLEKDLARASSRSFDNRSQRNDLVVERRRRHPHSGV